MYAVEFSHRSGRDLVNMAKKRTNVIPIIEDARHPAKYRMLVGMVDVIFSDVAQPDQVRISSFYVLSLYVNNINIAEIWCRSSFVYIINRIYLLFLLPYFLTPFDAILSF